jgi:hypothetical protein
MLRGPSASVVAAAAGLVLACSSNTHPSIVAGGAGAGGAGAGAGSAGAGAAGTGGLDAGANGSGASAGASGGLTGSGGSAPGSGGNGSLDGGQGGVDAGPTCEDLSLPMSPDPDCFTPQRRIPRMLNRPTTGCVGVDCGNGCCWEQTSCFYSDSSGTPYAGCTPTGNTVCGIPYPAGWMCPPDNSCSDPEGSTCCPYGHTCHTCVTPPAFVPREYGTNVTTTLPVATTCYAQRPVLTANGAFLLPVFPQGQSKTDLFLYEGGAWTQMPSESFAAGTSVGSPTVGVANGMLWVLTSDGSTAGVWHRFSVASRTWLTPLTTTLPEAIPGGPSSSLPLIEVGGYFIVDALWHTRQQRYDIANNQWVPLTPAPASYTTVALSSQLVIGTKVYTTAPNNLDPAYPTDLLAYDVPTDTWSLVHSFPNELPVFLGIVGHAGDRLLGLFSDYTAVLYDPATDASTPISAPGPEVGATIEDIASGAVSGWTGTVLMYGHYFYDPSTDRWGRAAGEPQSSAFANGTFMTCGVNTPNCGCDLYTPPAHLLPPCE